MNDADLCRVPDWTAGLTCDQRPVHSVQQSVRAQAFSTGISTGTTTSILCVPSYVPVSSQFLKFRRNFSKILYTGRVDIDRHYYQYFDQQQYLSVSSQLFKVKQEFLSKSHRNFDKSASKFPVKQKKKEVRRGFRNPLPSFTPFSKK